MGEKLKVNKKTLISSAQVVLKKACLYPTTRPKNCVRTYTIGGPKNMDITDKPSLQYTSSTSISLIEC